jgi:hypothetical protein
MFKVNLKGSTQPFAVVAPPTTDGNLISSYTGHGKNSSFNWWDHWPVSQDASDGRGAKSSDNPSHSSLCHFALPGHSTANWEPFAKGENWETRIMMHGMTNKKVEELVPMAKSWLHSADLKLSGSSYESEGYDPRQMAYVLNCKKSSDLELKLEASDESPVINPAFVVKNWGDKNAELTLDGKKIERGDTFRYGIEKNLESTDLVVWIKTESTKPVTVKLAQK